MHSHSPVATPSSPSCLTLPGTNIPSKGTEASVDFADLDQDGGQAIAAKARN